MKIKSVRFRVNALGIRRRLNTEVFITCFKSVESSEKRSLYLSYLLVQLTQVKTNNILMISWARVYKSVTCHFIESNNKWSSFNHEAEFLRYIGFGFFSSVWNFFNCELIKIFLCWLRNFWTVFYVLRQKFNAVLEREARAESPIVILRRMGLIALALATDVKNFQSRWKK